MLMVLLLLGYLLLSPLELSPLAKYSMAVSLSVPNMLLLKSGDYCSADADLNPLLMTWSLGIEEQFYIVLPFILLLAVRLRRTMTGVVLLLSLLSLAGCLWLTPLSSTQAFYLLPTRAWELGAGVLLWQSGGLKSRVSEAVILGDEWKIAAQRDPCMLD